MQSVIRLKWHILLHTNDNITMSDISVESMTLEEIAVELSKVNKNKPSSDIWSELPQ